jgi:hypothetical protein
MRDETARERAGESARARENDSVCERARWRGDDRASERERAFGRERERLVEGESIWLYMHLQICFLWCVRTVHGERSEMLAPAGAKALTPAVIPAITSAAYFMLCL